MKFVFVFIFLTLLHQMNGEARLHPVSFQNIEINKTINGSLVNNHTHSYSFLRKAGQTIRIDTVLMNNQSKLQLPLLISVEQRYSILSWTLPLNLSKYVGFSYDQVSRTLCSDYTDESSNITIWILTSSETPINYTIKVTLVSGFTLVPNTTSSHRKINISDGSPQYFLVSFPHNASSDVMRISLNSPDSSCIKASLQPAECPVDDLLSTIQYRGVYLTFNKTADITIDKNSQSSGAHYLVLVSAPDSACTNSYSSYTDSNAITLSKTVDIMVALELARWAYWQPVLILLVLLLLPSIILIPIFLIETCIVFRYKYLEKQYPFIFYTPDLSNMVREDYEPIPDQGPNKNTPLIANKPNSREEETYDLLTDEAAADKIEPVGRSINTRQDESLPLITSHRTLAIVGMHRDDMKQKYNQKNFHLNDLSHKNDEYLFKKFFLYLTSVITVTMFYALPALQVAIFRVFLYNSGDNDLCYFNFKCAHTLGGAVSFNNIWSNIAYLVLGLAFIMLTGIKQYLRYRLLKESDTPEFYRERGVTPYFGMYYAMGFALVSEGIMSSIYHTCPSGINFQFDSTFMFVIGTLCILKLYQNRHPDISVGAATAFLLLGTLIILTAFGLLTGREGFFLVRTTYALIVIGVTFLICIHIYFFSYPTLFCIAIWDTVKSRSIGNLYSSLKNCIWPPKNRPRIVHIIFLIIINILSLACLFWYRFDAASALLIFIVANLVFYVVYYWVMKIVYGELCHRPIVAIFSFFLASLATLLFIVALVFFFSSVTNWQKSPSSSRMLNKECVFLGFYDNHDIWHILSAFGLFFNSLSIIMIDDNISDLPKKSIRVF